MRVSLFYELQIPKPWTGDDEERIMFQALEQLELADRLGYHCVWQVEHHFNEEYCHCTAPEVFLGALSQRTKNIRLGHGIMVITPRYNHPVRCAERVATLDLLSGGRVEFGTGESTSNQELGGFMQERATKNAAWREAVHEIPRMMVSTPYPGFQGEYFQMPVRNVIPKPKQKPHPPMWVACTRPATVAANAVRGFGALTFGLVDPENAHTFVESYYDSLSSDEAHMGSYVVNPNIAFTSGFFCAKTEDEAYAKGLDGTNWFGYSLGHYGVFGKHRPGRTNLTDEFNANKEAYGLTDQRNASEKAEFLEQQSAGASFNLADTSRMLQSGLGTPDQLREHFLKWEEAGADEVILIAQAGATKHEDICESLELFGTTILPEIMERDIKYQEEKRKRLEPAIERIMSRPLPEREADDIVVPSDPTWNIFSDQLTGAAAAG